MTALWIAVFSPLVGALVLAVLRSAPLAG